MMHDLEVSRDKAIEKLKQTRGRVKHNSKFSCLVNGALPGIWGSWGEAQFILKYATGAWEQANSFGVLSSRELMKNVSGSWGERSH